MAQALKSGLLDHLGVGAALAVEVGEGAVGLGDRLGEALELGSMRQLRSYEYIVNRT